MALSFCVMGSAASNRRARGVIGVQRIDERQHIADRVPAFGRSAPRLLLVPALCALSGRLLLLRRLFRKGSAGRSRVMHPVCIVTRYVGEIDNQAEEMFERLTRRMAVAEDITEQLKATDQMVWVGRMNNIRNRATEIINTEIIFT